MKIHQGDGARPIMHLFVVVQSQLDDLSTTSFLRPDRQLDVMRIVKREATKDRVTIDSAAQTYVGLEYPMRETECISKNIDLSIATRPWNAIVNFLQEQQVGPIVRNRIDDSLEPILAIDTTDSLVNIVCH
jgi:hypothetical protein